MVRNISVARGSVMVSIMPQKTNLVCARCGAVDGCAPDRLAETTLVAIRREASAPSLVPAV